MNYEREAQIKVDDGVLKTYQANGIKYQFRVTTQQINVIHAHCYTVIQECACVCLELVCAPILK